MELRYWRYSKCKKKKIFLIKLLLTREWQMGQMYFFFQMNEKGLALSFGLGYIVRELHFA